MQKIVNIAIAGLPQSGSTRLYNFLRILFVKLNYTVNCGFTDFKIVNHFNGNFPQTVNLIKGHWLNRSPRKTPLTTFDVKCLEKHYHKIFFPYRDIRDIAVSAIKRGFAKDFITASNYVKGNLKNYYNYTASLKNFKKIKYEDWNEQTIDEILKYLEVSLEKDILKDISAEIESLYHNKNLPAKDNINNPIYEYSLLSKAHNTDNGKSKKYLSFFSLEENQAFLDNPLVHKFLTEHHYI